MNTINPSVSIVIPSRDGYREGNVPRLIQSLSNQTFQDFEVCLIKGVYPCSRAHNQGVKDAKGEIIVFFDDDIVLGNVKVIKNLISPLITDKHIGITGASQLIPPDANWFQRSYAKEFPRSEFPVVDRLTDTDMATHAAMAIKKEIFIKVGGENEDLVRGDDPDLRYRVRKAGYRICVVPNTWVYHPMPKNFKSLLKIHFKNGIGAWLDFKYNPQLLFETPPGSVKDFVPLRSVYFRRVRYLYHIFNAIFTCKLLFLSARIMHGLGYLYAVIFSQRAKKMKL